MENRVNKLHKKLYKMIEIKVLIVDDDDVKVKQIRNLLTSIVKIKVHYEIVADAHDCRKKLSQNQYDLLILDLVIPERRGDDSNANNSINILEGLRINKRYKIPYFIIGLTSYNDKIEEYESSFLKLIQYEQNTNKWEREIIFILEFLSITRSHYRELNPTSYDYDVAIITALDTPEKSEVLKLSDWKKREVSGDSTIYHETLFKHKNGRELKAIAASAQQMGMVAATDLTNKLLFHFRPQIIIMAGIAAGFEGKPGDILIANSCFDYGSGKINQVKNDNGEVKDVFAPDYRYININPDLISVLTQLKTERTELDNIKQMFEENEKKEILHKLNIHLGPFASGAGVVASETKVKEITKYARKLIGIDMEAYGVYYAVANSINPKPKYCLSIKSKSDGGDAEKSDEFQLYASYTSARYIYYLLTQTDLFD